MKIEVKAVPSAIPPPPPPPDIVLTLDMETAKTLRYILSFTVSIPSVVEPGDLVAQKTLCDLMTAIFHPLANAIRNA